MASFSFPSYLLPIHPNRYVDRRTGQYVQLLPEQVQQMYLQEQNETTQSYAQQHAFGAARSAAPCQAQTQPLTINNFGHIDFRPMHLGSQQSGSSNYNFGSNHVRSQQQALCVSQNNAQLNFGGYNAMVIDLTDDSWDEAPIVTPTTENNILSKDQAAVEVKPAPAPRVKASSASWRKGEAYLNKRLNNQGGSDAWRLFESMKMYPPSEKKHRYCQEHWHNEEAAFDDILQMSRQFLDADEMLTYALKWDQLGALSVLEDPSEEDRIEREQLEADIAAEKASLEEALPEKKIAKQESEEQAQWENWMQNLTRGKFQNAFGEPKTATSVRKVARDRQKKLAKEKAEKEAALKRKANSMPAELERPCKKPKIRGVQARNPKVIFENVAPELVQEMGSDVDAEGETDDEADAFAVNLAAQFEEEDSAADDAATPIYSPLQAFENLYSEYLSPLTLFSQPESVDREIVNPEDYLTIPAEPLEYVTTSISPFRTELLEDRSAKNANQTSEQTTALASLAALTSREENTIVQRVERHDSLSLDTGKISEHVIAPTETFPLPPLQKEDTVAVEESLDENFDDLFQDDEGIMDEGNTPITDVEAAGDLLTAIFSEDPALSIDDIEVAEDLPAPISKEKAIVLAAKKAELTKAQSNFKEALTESQAEIVDLERKIDLATTSANPWMRKRMEQSRPDNKARLQELKREVEEQKGELWMIEQELIGMPSMEEVVAEKLKVKNVAGPCGGTMMR